MNRLFSKFVAVVFVGLTAANANANSVGFDLPEVTGEGPSLTLRVTVNYDFTEFAMFGGGLDIRYDTTALEFVAYIPAALSFDAQPAASPVGELTSLGEYTGFGVGTFEFFNGMNSQGEIGTFVFNFVALNTGATPCGSLICLTGNAINPFVSLAGADVTEQLLNNGLSTVDVEFLGPIPFPVPAAVWFMLSGLATLWGFGRVRS